MGCWIFEITPSNVVAGPRLIVGCREVWKQHGHIKQHRWEESEKRRKEEKKSEKRKSQKEEDAGARKGRKVAIHSAFPMRCGSRGSKSRLAKAASAQPFGEIRDEKLPLWRKAHVQFLQVKKLKAPHVRTAFGL